MYVHGHSIYILTLACSSLGRTVARKTVLTLIARGLLLLNLFHVFQRRWEYFRYQLISQQLKMREMYIKSATKKNCKYIEVLRQLFTENRCPTNFFRLN